MANINYFQIKNNNFSLKICFQQRSLEYIFFNVVGLLGENSVDFYHNPGRVFVSYVIKKYETSSKVKGTHPRVNSFKFISEYVNGKKFGRFFFKNMFARNYSYDEANLELETIRAMFHCLLPFVIEGKDLDQSEGVKKYIPIREGEIR